MFRSYRWFLRVRYRGALKANVQAQRLPDALAQDAQFSLAVRPSGTSIKARTDALFKQLTVLRKYWQQQFDTWSLKIAEQAADDWYETNVQQWNGHIKRAGFDIKLQMTPSQRLILRSKIRENVSLIKSIHEDYHKSVEGDVLRSFTAGRDLAQLADALETRHGVTQRRAAFIARDQSNKATAALNQARQRELDIEWAQWIHSRAGKEPRPDHVRAGREQWYFRTQDGIDFQDGFSFVCPGEAINCRCQSRSIIPMLVDAEGFNPKKLEPVPGFPGAYRMRR